MTLQTLRPDSQVKLFGVTRVPNVSAELNLNDAPADDATYVHGTYHGAGLHLGLTGYTLAAGERVRYATPRARIFHNSADVGHREYVDFRFRDPDTGKTTTAASMNTVSNTAIESTKAAQPKGPGGLAWSQALITRLQVDLAWHVSAGGQFLRVSEVYVDLDINSQPVVSAVTASNFTASTRPSWSYTWTDADNDAQTRWRVKVFSAAQFGIAGFNPDSSPYTWDSGEAFGNADSGTITADLVNGVTYRFYAKAAQAWPGAEGPLWWSAWANSSSFTVALSPPITPSLTVVGQPDVPGYRALLTVTAPYNVLTEDDASMETTAGTWVNDTNATVIRSTTNPGNGVGALQMTATAGATMAARTANGTSGYAVTGGAQYTAVASFRAATTGRSANVKIRWYNRAGGLDSTSTGSNVTDTTGGYTQAFVTATAPAAAVFAGLVVEVVSAAAAEVHRVDMVSLHRGASVGWTTGGMGSSAAITVERAEKVALAFRGPATNWAHPQLASGGGLTRDNGGFYSRVAAVLTSEPLDGPAMTGSAGGGIARMIVWRPTVGAFSFLDWGLDNNPTTSETIFGMPPAVPGLQTRLACWARVRTGTFSTKLFVFTVDHVNTIIGSASTTATLTTTWQRLTVDITPAAGDVYLRGGLENSAAAVEQDVCVTGIRYCPTSVDDGTTPPGQGLEGIWYPVRTFDPTVPSASGQTYVLYDHEAPPGRPVMYRARTTATVAGQAVSSASSAPVNLHMTPPTRTVVKDPWQPENAMVLSAAAGDTWNRGDDSAVFHPLGRDGDPVKRRDWLSGRDTGLNITALSDAELYQLQNLLPSASQLLVQWSEGGQTYYLITGYTSTRVRPGFHRLTAAALETARP